MTSSITAPVMVALNGTGCDFTDVGGKAAGLDRLASHGFPVPSSFAITVPTYRFFVATTGLAGWLEELAASPLPEPDRLDSAGAQVEEAFLRETLPDPVAKAIAEVVRPMLKTGAVAVRSSAVAEDLGIASFAGQYRTFVRVENLDDVFDSVRRCWASLWLPAARAYRARHDIDLADLAMGVVVQSMVEPDWSGVGFTKDPEGIPGAMRIEMVPGLGEALVSGRITPYDYVVSKKTLEIRSRGDHPAPAFLEDLARMLLQVENKLDEPQDVEWAYGDGELFLLQSRPITVAGPTAALDDGFDRPTGGSDTFTPRGVVEMLPGVIPPLLWTINAAMLENAFRDVVNALGNARIQERRSFVGRFQGRSALNLSALQDVARQLPGGSPTEVEQQFLGHAVSDAEESPAPTRRPSLKAVLRARRAQNRIADEVELVSGAISGILDLNTDVAALPARKLLAYQHSARDLAWRTYAAEVAASSAGAAAYRGLELLLQRWLEDAEAAEWAQRLTAGALTQDAVGVARTRALREAYQRAVATNPELRSALLGRPRSRSRDRVIHLGADGRRFVDTVDRIIRSQGSRAVYAGPTWDEDQDWVWEQLAIHAGIDEEPAPQSDRDEEFAMLMDRLRGSRRWKTLRVITGQVVDLRERWLRRQVNEAVRFLSLRERAKASLLALGGEERRIVLEGAKRLVTSRQLLDADDVMLLSDREFAEMLLGAHAPPEAELYRRLTVRHRCRQAGPLPASFVGSPGEAPHIDVPTAATMQGWAASPGVVEGTARIVMSLDTGGRLRRGDILVAPTTDASWTPLMLVAAGLVLEEGGPLSHGAIVAREFGLPAVLNIPGVTAALRDGEPVEVDGYAGVVRRIDPPLAEKEDR
jgi:pyruvate,water dikinase